MSPFLSLVINVDTRPGLFDKETSFSGHNQGCRSIDFLVEGIKNKQKFFAGFEYETIVFVDEHEPIPVPVLQQMRELVDTLVIKKHDRRYQGFKEFVKFNDVNYLHAFSLARGSYVVHFDSDTSAFRASEDYVRELLSLADVHDFVSYPSHWSPLAVVDNSFDYMWASTRFFICKSSALDISELQKCLLSDEYLYGTYGDRFRKCPWMEHILGLTSKKGVFYPPVEYDKGMIFCWSQYQQGVLQMLNGMSYGSVMEYVKFCGGIQYPNDVRARIL